MYQIENYIQTSKTIETEFFINNFLFELGWKNELRIVFIFCCDEWHNNYTRCLSI